MSISGGFSCPSESSVFPRLVLVLPTNPPRAWFNSTLWMQAPRSMSRGPMGHGPWATNHRAITTPRWGAVFLHPDRTRSKTDFNSPTLNCRVEIRTATLSSRPFQKTISQGQPGSALSAWRPVRFRFPCTRTPLRVWVGLLAGRRIQCLSAMYRPPQGSRHPVSISDSSLRHSLHQGSSYPEHHLKRSNLTR